MKRRFKGPRFLLVGNGSYENRGCEAIVRGSVEAISRKYPGASFILSSIGDGCAGDAVAETDERIVHRPHQSSTVRKLSADWWRYRVFHRSSSDWRHLVFRSEYEAAKRSVCAMQIGGDNYTLDYGRPERHVHLDDMLRSTGKPLVLWGASVGPFTSDPDYEKQMRDHLSRFDLIVARESETASYLASIGVEKNVKLAADPAFLLSPCEPELDAKLKSILDDRPLGVNLSPLAGRYCNADEDRWLDNTTECVKALVDAGIGQVLLVPHVICAGNDDHEFMTGILGSLCENGDRVTLLPDNLSAAQTKWVIAKTRMFVGARTHATIAALSSGVPTISIGYSLKAQGINKDVFGNLDWLLPVDKLSASSLVEKVHDLLRDGESVRQELAAAIPRAVASAQSAADYLADVLC